MTRDVEVARLSALPDGEACGFRVQGRDIALCRAGSEVFALEGTCSYHPISLHGAKLDGVVLTCPWYGAQFDVRTGESVFLSSARPVDTVPVSVQNGRVFVRLSES